MMAALWGSESGSFAVGSTVGSAAQNLALVLKGSFVPRGYPCREASAQNSGPLGLLMESRSFFGRAFGG